MPPPNYVEEHLTLDEASARLKVGKSTIRREIRSGHIAPVRKLGHRTVLIPASSLNRFLIAHTI